MNRFQIDRFFKILARELDQKTTAILTGAAAGALMGRVRPSLDIDFAVELAKRNQEAWRRLEEAIRRTVKITGIQADFAEDIDRWGLITLLDYKKRARPYRRFGSLAVRVLDPAYWTIGKMTRFLDSDVRDMAEVLKKQRVPAGKLAGLWGKALRKSPRSAAQFQFRGQVENFLKTQGRQIWGPAFDLEKIIHKFHESAGFSPPLAKR